MTEPKRRLRACVESWPDAETGEYSPACCRFPKSCSVTIYDVERVSDDDLEPVTPEPKRGWGNAPAEIVSHRGGWIWACYVGWVAEALPDGKRLMRRRKEGGACEGVGTLPTHTAALAALTEHQKAEHVDAVFRGDRGGPLGMAMDRTSERNRA